MNNQSMFSIRHWSLTEMLFAAAGCFALAAVGFFIAVFLELHTSTVPEALNPQTKGATQADKDQVLQALSGTQNSANATTSTSVGSTHPVAPSQADTKDANASAKLNALDALNAH
jgi:hypothetical protein